MQSCQPMLANKQYKQYRACALDALKKAGEVQEMLSFCNDPDGIDYFKKGKVTSDLYPNGIEDYTYTFSNGKTYVIEGACSSDKKYVVYQKNCKEFGDGFVAMDGMCQMPPYSFLQSIWGIDTAKIVESSETKCSSMTNDQIKQYVKTTQMYEYDPTLSKDLIVKTLATEPQINIIYPSNKDGDPVLSFGEFISKIGMQKMKSYFGKYPCEQLNIFAYRNAALGGPGIIEIGAPPVSTDSFGFNDPGLLWHEMTHSFFGSFSTGNAYWLTEGAAAWAVPDIMLVETYDAKDPNWKQVGAKPIDTAFVDIEKMYNLALSQNPNVQVYFQKNACDLKMYDGINNSYLENGDWGYMFLLDVAKQFGNSIVTNSLRDVYRKYRYTNLTPISNQDVYDAFMYEIKDLTQQKKSSAVKLIKSKLCM